MIGHEPTLLAFSTLGAGSNEEARLRELLTAFSTEWFPFDRSVKLQMSRQLIRAVRTGAHDLVVMEGSGIAGGIPLIILRLIFGTRYVVSSGDAVGPFVASQYRYLGMLFGLYEWLLYRNSSGFIGWTPYLVGRAISFGAGRAVTAQGWAPFPRDEQELAEARARIRALHGIPAEALVIGIVGSLAWNSRIAYCYGLELVEALRGLERDDLRVLIVGDGTGRSHLEAAVRNMGDARVIFVGQVPQANVPDYLAAMDVGSLPQSVDRVGAFRYTTKISEYLSCGVPIVTGQTPMAYDLDAGWLWRLPGRNPWDKRYTDSLRSFLARLARVEICKKRRRASAASHLFERDAQVQRVTSFINEILVA